MLDVPHVRLRSEFVLTYVTSPHLGGCPGIDVLFKIEAFFKNKRSHIVDISSIIFFKITKSLDEKTSFVFSKTVCDSTPSTVLSRCVFFYTLFLFPFLLCHLLFQHDFKDSFIRLHHTVVAQCTHILDGFSCRVSDDSIGILNIYSLK